MHDNGEAVQGIGLYCELTREHRTAQFIVTPDGYNSAGTFVPMHLLRRAVDADSPRKQWRLGIMEVDPDTILAASVTTEAEMNAYAEKRTDAIKPYLDQLLRSSWVIVKAPILLEVSKKDLDLLSEGKPPQKLMYRITQSRIANGFPTELFPGAK